MGKLTIGKLLVNIAYGGKMGKQIVPAFIFNQRFRKQLSAHTYTGSTGFEKTNMGEILQPALKGSQFTFHPDPYPDQQLFYRSDNATLARLGVPAHTISTSKMDNEPNYHKPSDEVGTLDLENMAQIIKAIAESSKTIVSGKETPTRVKEESLR